MGANLENTSLDGSGKVLVQRILLSKLISIYVVLLASKAKKALLKAFKLNPANILATGPNWSELVPTGQNWSKLVKLDQTG